MRQKSVCQMEQRIIVTPNYNAICELLVTQNKFLKPRISVFFCFTFVLLFIKDIQFSVCLSALVLEI